MAQLLSDEIKQQVQDVFADLKQEVAILFFGSDPEQCTYCEDTRQLLEEVAGLSDKIHFETYIDGASSEVAQKYQVEKVPGIVIAARDGDEIVDYGIRYAGIPAGHEFTSLIRDILMVSARDSGLAAETRAFLSELPQDVHLRVFVTPTCPYCPQAVVLAHQMAFESPRVRAEMIEAMEFPDLSDEFGVSGVPHTSINFGAAELIGAAPEGHLIDKIKQSLAVN